MNLHFVGLRSLSPLFLARLPSFSVDFGRTAHNIAENAGIAEAVIGKSRHLRFNRPPAGRGESLTVHFIWLCRKYIAYLDLLHVQSKSLPYGDWVRRLDLIRRWTPHEVFFPNKISILAITTKVSEPS